MQTQQETSIFSLRDKLRLHLSTPLFRNGYALTISSAMTSGIGLLYWILAAHQYPANEIGINSAMLSAMMFLAGISELNLMSALIRFIPAAGHSTRRFVIVSYSISLVISAVVSFVFIHYLQIWSPALQFINDNRYLAIWFVLSTMAYSIFVLQDSVLTGLRQATWVPVENTVFSATKIVLMLIFATSIPMLGIFASWSLALIVAILPTNFYIFRNLIQKHEQDERQKQTGIVPHQVVRFVAADYLGALFWMVSTTLLPVIVTTVAGATANAYFYLPWTIASSLYLISPSMGSSLIVESAKDQKKLSTYSYKVLIHTAEIVIPAAIFLIIGAPYILTIFGKGYSAQGTTLLRLLALSAIPNIINTNFISVARVQRHMRAVVLSLGALCVMVLGLSFALLKIDGIVGVGISWMVSQTIMSVILYTFQLRSLWESSGETPVEEKFTSYWKNRKTDMVRALFLITSESRILSAIKFPRQYWLSQKRKSKVKRLLNIIIDESPFEAYKLALANLEIRRLANTVTDKTVTFLGPYGEPSSIVMKLPGSNKDVESLLNHWKNLTDLHNDLRLGEWRRLLPVIVLRGKINRQEYFIERTLPGVTVHQMMRDPESRQRILSMAAQAIGELHRKTASSKIVDEEMLQYWVRNPLHNIQCLAANGSSIKNYQKQLSKLACTFDKTLTGHKIGISWIHGDYSPLNILVNPAGSEITGIVDWELACPNDIPQLDLIHLVLSNRMSLYRRELGEIVRELLLKDNWTSEEMELINVSQSMLPGEPIALNDLLLLSWLRHINANLVKTSRFTHNKLWAIENIETVLQVL